MLHDGPVPQKKALEALSEVRAAYLSEAFGYSLAQAREDFRRRDETVRDHAAYDRIELWFEHDLYDQLQLLQLLAFFAAEKRKDGVLLIQADDYLGRQPPDAVGRLGATAAPVTPEQSMIATLAWRAFGDSTPEGMVSILDANLDALPWFEPALLRLLAELPAPVTGLGLTEERILAAIAAGAATPARAFAHVSAEEEARFMGDASFFRLLDGLTFADQPLIAGIAHRSRGLAAKPTGAPYRAYANAPLRLTDFGRRVMAGEADHAAVNAIDRWWGGTHLTGAEMWRWDRHAGELIEPRDKAQVT